MSITLAKYTVKKNIIAMVGVVLSVFVISVLIAPYYIGGDQETYTNIYNELSELGLADGFTLYTATLGAWEVVHFLVIWISSGIGLDKILVMAIANAILALSLMKLFIKWGVHFWLAAIITCTNFYFYTLYFPAERLKFGFLFLVISMLYWEKEKKFLTLVFFAVVSHLQTLILYGSLFFATKVKYVLRFKKLNFTWYGLAFFLFLFGALVFFSKHILMKYEIYSALTIQRDNATDIVRIFVFMMLAIFYSKQRAVTFLQFMPLIVCVYIIGGERINMIGYAIFLYYGLQCNKGVNFGVLLTTIYFAFKSFGFVLEIFETGSAFDPNWSILGSKLLS
jgi:hypothetical protein